MKIEPFDLTGVYEDFRYNPAYRFKETKKVIKWLQNAVKNEDLPAKVYVEFGDDIYPIVQKFNLFKGDILDEFQNVLMQAGICQAKVPDAMTEINPYDGHVTYADPVTVNIPIEFLIMQHGG